VTLLNYPYKLSDSKLDQYPIDKVQNYSLNVFDCTYSSPSDDCKQRWKLLLTLTPETCNLDGEYKINWNKTCAPELENNCPLSELSERASSVTFKLKSENFCAEISTDILLIGRLSSHANSTFLVSKSSWMMDSRGYFLVTVNSDLNSSPYNESNADIKFVRTDLVTVFIRSDNASSVPIKLWDNGNPAVFNSNEDPEVDIQVIPGTTGNRVGFSIVLSHRLSELLNNSTKFIIGAEVQVFYEGLEGQKRFVLSAGNDKVSYSTSVNVDDHRDEETYDRKQGSALSVLVNIILLFLVFLF
jgi:hypothetical protein